MIVMDSPEGREAIPLGDAFGIHFASLRCPKGSPWDRMTFIGVFEIASKYSYGAPHFLVELLDRRPKNKSVFHPPFPLPLWELPRHLSKNRFNFYIYFFGGRLYEVDAVEQSCNLGCNHFSSSKYLNCRNFQVICYYRHS